MSKNVLNMNMLINNPLKDVNSSSYPAIVKLKHYVLEFWYDGEISKTWANPMLVKDKDNYQVMDCLYAFQFYDLVNICINGEYFEGKKKYNIGPLVYMGKREYINENESIIIDKYGKKHLGESGITYDEYLAFINKKENKVLNRKLKKF